MNYKVLYCLVVLNCYCWACFNSLSVFLFCCKKKTNLNKNNHQKKRFYETDVSDSEYSSEGYISFHINNHYKKNPRIFAAEERELDSEKFCMDNNLCPINEEYKKYRIFEAEDSDNGWQIIRSNLDSTRVIGFYKRIGIMFKTVKNYF